MHFRSERKCTDLGDSGDLRDLLGDVGALVAGHQGRDVAAHGLGRRHGVQRARVELGAVVLGEHQRAGQAGVPGGGELQQWR